MVVGGQLLQVDHMGLGSSSSSGKVGLWVRVWGLMGETEGRDLTGQTLPIAVEEIGGLWALRGSDSSGRRSQGSSIIIRRDINMGEGLVSATSARIL